MVHKLADKDKAPSLDEQGCPVFEIDITQYNSDIHYVTDTLLCTKSNASQQYSSSPRKRITLP